MCPLVEESEESDVAAAEERAAVAAGAVRRPKVGLVHGRMKGPEKDAVMARFASRRAGRAGGDDGDRGEAWTCPTPR